MSRRAYWLLLVLVFPLAFGGDVHSRDEIGTHRQNHSWYPHDPRPPFVGAGVVEGVDSGDLVYAGNAVFRAGAPPEIPAELAKPLFRDRIFESGYFLVHYSDPIRAEDKALLDFVTGVVRRDDGSELARWYVPNNSLVAWIEDLSTLGAIRSAPRVDWVGRYEPGYKLDPTIGSVELSSPARVGRSSYFLDVDLIPGHDIDAVAEGIARLGARVLERVQIRGSQGYDVRFLVVEASPALVTAVAAVEGVRTVQERGDGMRTYDLSAGGKLQNRTLSVDDQSASPIVTASAFPLWVTHNLQGQGQLLGIVDTSLDYNNVGTAGCDFGFSDTDISNWFRASQPVSRAAPERELGAELESASHGRTGRGDARDQRIVFTRHGGGRGGRRGFLREQRPEMVGARRRQLGVLGSLQLLRPPGARHRA